MDFLIVFSNPSGNIKKVLTKRRQEKKFEKRIKTHVLREIPLNQCIYVSSTHKMGLHDIPDL